VFSGADKMSIPCETVHSQNNRTCDEHHTAKAFEWQKLDVVMKVGWIYECGCGYASELGHYHWNFCLKLVFCI